MTLEKKPSRLYFAGAYVSFGIAFIGVELLSLIYGVSPADPELQANLSIVIVGLHLLGGIVGGFLVAKRSQGDRLQSGTVTGVLAYVIEQIVHAVLYGWGAVGDVYTMLALIGGSVAGAVSYDSQVKRMQRLRDSQPTEGEAADTDGSPDEPKVDPPPGG